MQTSNTVHLPTPTFFIDVDVDDADLIPHDDSMQTIHIWYTQFSQDHQDKMCGHDFLNYLRNVRCRKCDNLKQYWYSTKPEVRDQEVEEWMEYRANNMLTKSQQASC
jgi:hypothetical protein